MGQPRTISYDDILNASDGHRERTDTPFGADSIDAILIQLGVENPEDVKHLIHEMMRLRCVTDHVYPGGLIDGFILGVRAQRAAEQRTN